MQFHALLRIQRHKVSKIEHLRWGVDSRIFDAKRFIGFQLLLEAELYVVDYKNGENQSLPL